MKDTILMGVGREIHSLPNLAFVKSMKNIPASMAARLAFMTRDHHKVRDFVVRASCQGESHSPRIRLPRVLR